MIKKMTAGMSSWNEILGRLVEGFGVQLVAKIPVVFNICTGRWIDTNAASSTRSRQQQELHICAFLVVDQKVDICPGFIENLLIILFAYFLSWLK